MILLLVVGLSEYKYIVHSVYMHIRHEYLFIESMEVKLLYWPNPRKASRTHGQKAL